MLAAFLLLFGACLCKGARIQVSSTQSVHTVPDVLVRNEGTLFLFWPLTTPAKDWIEEHVQADAQWFGAALIVEHRYALGLVEGMKIAGLRLA